MLWTDEEAGGVGSQQYYDAHKTEAGNYSILLESDEGVFTPYGMRFTGSDAAMKVIYCSIAGGNGGRSVINNSLFNRLTCAPCLKSH